MNKIDPNDLKIVEEFNNYLSSIDDVLIILVSYEFWTHLVWTRKKLCPILRLEADIRKPLKYGGIRIIRTRDIKTHWELIK